MGPDVVGRAVVIGTQIFRALARRLHAKAGGARPIDHLGHQCRLVAIGHGIDDACRPRPFRQSRPGEHVGLDIHHHDMLAVLDRGQRMGDAGRRRAGRVDHHIDLIGGGQPAPVFEKGGRRDAFFLPADRAAGSPGALGRQIGDSGDFEAGRGGHLGQEHGAELAGSDQARAHRPAVIGARL